MRFTDPAVPFFLAISSAFSTDTMSTESPSSNTTLETTTLLTTSSLTTPLNLRTPPAYPPPVIKDPDPAYICKYERGGTELFDHWYLIGAWETFNAGPDGHVIRNAVEKRCGPLLRWNFSLRVNLYWVDYFEVPSIDPIYDWMAWGMQTYNTKACFLEAITDLGPPEWDARGCNVSLGSRFQTALQTWWAPAQTRRPAI